MAGSHGKVGISRRSIESSPNRSRFSTARACSRTHTGWHESRQHPTWIGKASVYPFHNSFHVTSPPTSAPPPPRELLLDWSSSWFTGSLSCSLVSSTLSLSPPPRFDGPISSSPRSFSRYHSTTVFQFSSNYLPSSKDRNDNVDELPEKLKSIELNERMHRVDRKVSLCR